MEKQQKISNNITLNDYIEALVYSTKPEELEDIIKSSFLMFFTVMYYIINDIVPELTEYHHTVINKLNDIADKKSDKLNLLLNLPVGFGKTTLIAYFNAFLFYIYPNRSDLFVVHKQQLKNEHFNNVKIIIEHAIAYTNSKIKLMKGKSVLKYEGSLPSEQILGYTIKSNITGISVGKRGKDIESGILLVDDPSDAKTAQSIAYNKSVIEAYSRALTTRKRSSKIPTIIIQQRLSFLDLSQYIIENHLQSFDVVSIPALVNNKSIYPNVRTTEELLEIQRSDPMLFASQYQQQPIVQGALMTKEDFPLYSDRQIVSIPSGVFFMTIDLAFKTNESNDFTVICLWMFNQEDGQLYLVSISRGKYSTDTIIREVSNLFKNSSELIDRPPYKGTRNRDSVVLIEDVTSSLTVNDLLRKEGIPTRLIKRNQDKFTRYKEVEGWIKSKFVHLYQNEPLLNIITNECSTFSVDNKGVHDDIVDNIVDAVWFTYILSYKGSMQKVKEQVFNNSLNTEKNKKGIIT